MKKLSKNKRKVKYEEIKKINKIVIRRDKKLSMSLCEKGDVIS